MRSRFRTATAILLCALLVGACLTLWGCDGQPAAEDGTSPSAPATDETATSAGGVTDQAAADIALRYFATTAADRMQGVAGGAPHRRGGPDTTVSSVPSTTTTLAPGQMTFDTVTDRFERLVDHEDLAGTVPYSVLPKDELTWLFDAAMPFAVTDARGYRFANGDLAVLFFLAPPPGGLDGAIAAAKEFAQLVYARFGDGDNGVWPHSGDRYGCVVVSKQYREDLGRLTQWAVSAHQLLIP